MTILETLFLSKAYYRSWLFSTLTLLYSCLGQITRAVRNEPALVMKIQATKTNPSKMPCELRQDRHGSFADRAPIWITINEP